MVLTYNFYLCPRLTVPPSTDPQLVWVSLLLSPEVGFCVVLLIMLVDSLVDSIHEEFVKHTPLAPRTTHTYSATTHSLCYTAPPLLRREDSAERPPLALLSPPPDEDSAELPPLALPSPPAKNSVPPHVGLSHTLLLKILRSDRLWLSKAHPC